MSSSPRVRVQREDFSLDQEIDRLREPRAGAIAAFVGTVRQRDGATVGGGDTQRLELEHYPGMTERAIEAMIDAAQARFDILAARVVHRIGVLAATDNIVLVAVASAHRAEAFSACEFLMDYLKTQAPFWKKEHRIDGSADWVDARVADDAALRRWGLTSGNAVDAVAAAAAAAATAAPADEDAVEPGVPVRLAP